MGNEWQTLVVDQIRADYDRAIAIGPFGSRMKADAYVTDGVPVIRGTNISDTREFAGEFVYVSDETADQLRSCNVFAGDLVFPHRGAIGRVGIVPDDETPRYMLSTSLMKLTCNRQIVDPLFVFYFFRSPSGQHALLQYASTVGTPGIGQPLTSLRSVELPVPPLDEQRAIAAILGALDDKIELNRRMNETLEGIARAIFKSWFVDFDPVRENMARKSAGAQRKGWPSSLGAEAQSGGEGMLPDHILDLFPDGFEDSELGEIPRGWGVGTLEDLALLNPENWTVRDYPEAIKYVDLSNTKWGSIDAVATYVRADAPSRARRVLRPSDTIVGTVRPGNGSYAFVSEHGLTGSTGFAVLRPKAPRYAEFIYLAATSADNITTLAHLADGGAYPAVRPETITATTAPVPDVEPMTLFSTVVRPIMDRVAAAKAESCTLADLRDTLLSKLISGDLRVPEAELITRRTP